MYLIHSTFVMDEFPESILRLSFMQNLFAVFKGWYAEFL